MDKDLLEETIREAATLGVTEVIPSTMGEPLLYPHFDLILDLCKELNLKLNLTTNGTFPCRKKENCVEYWAQRVVPICNDVKISWNGASESIQQKIMGTSIDTHIDKARRFVAIRDKMATSTDHYCSMTMQLPFMRHNLSEIPKMVALAIELGFDRIKGHQLWPHFPELEEQSLHNNLDWAKQWNVVVTECQTLVNTHIKTTGKIFNLDNFHPLNISQSKKTNVEGNCPFLGKEIWVDPTGRINVCCAPDQQRKSLGDFGNLNKTSLSSMLSSEAYSYLRENYLEFKLCQECRMRRPDA
jgi:MoaA/NifB/PqqE/SkfB family radical SAM enzyme